VKKIAFVVFACLAILLAAAFPSWIELITGWDPDGHNGSVELFIAGGLLTLAVLAFAAAAVRRRRGAQKPRADARTVAGATG
jgi:MYXO-CTERM domain-containing protein